jgi:decaprenyl-diphosphate synthase subunit 2
MREAQTKGSTEDSKLPNAIKADEGVTTAIDLCCYHGNQSSIVLEWFPF